MLDSVGEFGMIESTIPSPNWGDTWLRRLLEVAALSEPAREAVRRSPLTLRQSSARDHIIRDGVRDIGIRIMIAGLACRYKHLPDGRRQITAFIVPGDICDYSFLADGPVSQDVVALSPSTVGMMDLDRLSDMVEAHPEIMTAILRCGAVEHNATQELLVSLGGRNALQRVGHLLCEMHFRLNRAGLVRTGGVFELPLTQSEMGEALGLSTVHVNRTVQILRRLGLATWRDRVVTLPDPAALAKLCDFDAGYLQVRKD